VSATLRLDDAFAGFNASFAPKRDDARHGIVGLLRRLN
jgi:hypothetical protein